MDTRTVMIDWDRLSSRTGADTMLRLAMAVNDLAFTDLLFRQAKKIDVLLKSALETGLLVYLMRVQLSHLREARQIMQKLLADPDLSGYVDNLSDDGREHMLRLRSVMRNAKVTDVLTEDEQLYKGIILDLRNSIGFHYDKSLAEKALARLAKETQAFGNSIAFSNQNAPADTWMTLADTAVMTIIADIWGIDTENLTKDELEIEVNRRLKWSSDLSRSMFRVGQELCISYFLESKSFKVGW